MEIAKNISLNVDKNQFQIGAAYIVLPDMKVIINSSSDSKSYQNEIDSGVGSSEGFLGLEWSDSLVFSRVNRELTILEMYIPNEITTPSLVDKFESREIIEANLKLPNDIEYFELVPQSFRCYLSKYDLLICFNSEDLSLVDLLEIKVSENFSFFQKDGKYVGWGMFHPELYISSNFFERVKHDKNDSLKSQFVKVFHKLDSEFYDRMQDQELSALQELSQLYNAIEVSSESDPQKILKDFLYDQCDRYYWDMNFEKYLS